MNVEWLRGKFFLDTNILVYSFDARTPEKQQIARQLIETALSTQQGMISSQVVQEFLHVSQRKFVRPLTSADAIRYINTVLRPLCRHFPTIGFYERTILLQDETGYGFYDSMILMAAIHADCQLLLSEDLQNGRNVRGVTILNPFLNH